MSHRRSLSVVAAAVAATVALAGCSSQTAAPSSSSAPIAGAITYSFWGSPARADKVKSTIDLFEKKEPKAQVTADVADYNSYIERLTVRAAGGQLPCVVGTQSTFISTYATSGVLEPLDDLIKNGQIDTSGIPKSVMDTGKINGKQYMIPTGTFLRIVAYNEDLVKAAGLTNPTDHMTWEQYASWLKELQKKLPSGVSASEIEAPNMFSFTSWVVGHGQQMFKNGKLGFSKTLMKQWFQYWIDLTKAGVTVPTSSIPNQVAALELTPLALGKAAVGTRDIPQLYITENALKGAGKPSAIGHVSIPSESAKQSANILGSNGVSIPASCKNQSTAASFVNFFANDPRAGVAFQSDNGILTNTKAQKALLADAGTPDPVKQNVTILQGLTKSGDVTNTTYPNGLQTLTTALSTDYQAAAFGQQSVSQAVDQFFTTAATAIK